MFRQHNMEEIYDRYIINIDQLQAESDSYSYSNSLIDHTLVNHNVSACVPMYFDFHRLPLHPNISVCSPRL